MEILVFDKAAGDALRGEYGKFSALDPVATPDGKFMLPSRCLDDADLADAVALMNSSTEGTNEILPLPELGEQCLIGILYTDTTPRDIDEETGSNVLKCVQTHNRTEHDPKTIPALFTFFRENSDDLVFIENEYVYLGWFRWFDGVQYEVIQEHMTLPTWTPPDVPALWQAVAPPVAVWVQPTGAHNAYNTGDQVYFPTVNDPIYESLIDANTWSPAVYPAGWTEI